MTENQKNMKFMIKAKETTFKHYSGVYQGCNVWEAIADIVTKGWVNFDEKGNVSYFHTDSKVNDNGDVICAFGRRTITIIGKLKADIYRLLFTRIKYCVRRYSPVIGWDGCLFLDFDFKGANKYKQMLTRCYESDNLYNLQHGTNHDNNYQHIEIVELDNLIISNKEL